MGQHKYNPTAIAAKEGKLPPKKKNQAGKMKPRRNILGLDFYMWLQNQRRYQNY